VNKFLLGLMLLGLVSCGSTKKEEEKKEAIVAPTPPQTINVYCSPAPKAPAPVAAPSTPTGVKN